VIASGVAQNQKIIELNEDRHNAEYAEQQGIEKGKAEMAATMSAGLREMCDDGRITGDICDGD
jgi:hypothetical protein